MDSKQIGELLARLRKERGMTQQELADKIGLTTKVTISQYETGKRKPSFEMIEALADVFHVDMNYLLGFTDRIQKPAGDETDPAVNKYLGVTLEEIELVEAWRHADDQTKRIVAYALGLKGMK